MATVYTRGNFKQPCVSSGCEWISATNRFCPKPELAIVGKKCCGLRQSGGVGEVSAPQLFRDTPFAQANGVSARGRKLLDLPGNLLVAKNPPCRKIATSAHFRFRLILHFAIRPDQGVTCQDVVRWVNGKFSYERPGTLGSPLGYILLPPAAS